MSDCRKTAATRVPEKALVSGSVLSCGLPPPLSVRTPVPLTIISQPRAWCTSAATSVSPTPSFVGLPLEEIFGSSALRTACPSVSHGVRPGESGIRKALPDASPVIGDGDAHQPFASIHLCCGVAQTGTVLAGVVGSLGENIP